MSAKIDAIDRKILSLLQRDATLSIDAISEKVSLSRNACWRRVKRLESERIIKGRVSILDQEKIGLELTVFVLIRTNSHDHKWVESFKYAVKQFPEIVGAHRMSGDLDYILRVVVASVADYDHFYQRLIKKVQISDVSASFAMEAIVETTALPLFSQA